MLFIHFMVLRSLICTTLGHVDHGKSSILDKIRGTAIVKSEAGAITQAIGASIIPITVIKKICGSLFTKLQCTIPGLLFIDTPGHAAFTNLRKRGGNLADIAILVVNLQEGVMPQTVESIEILKNYKTPFVIAANKLDLLSGWSKKDDLLLNSIAKQPDKVKQELDKKVYTLVGKLSELGFNSERFDRVEDYTKQIAIVPTSAITGEGIPELLMVLTGLAQKFIQTGLDCDIKGNACGTILEVKDVKGLGTCLDAIIYNGTLRKNDCLVIGGLQQALISKVRGLFEPMPLAEMRDKKSKFKPVDMVVAATGVRINATEMKDVVAGMPIRSCSPDELEDAKKEVQKEVDEVLIETDNEGIVIKADTLGSLEALIKLLKDKGIPIKKASIGNVTKKDVADAEANLENNPLEAAILGFNVTDDTGSDIVKILTNDVIYKLIEDFGKWQDTVRKEMKAKQLDLLTKPAKIQIMRGYVFRQSNPAVCGIDVLSGTLKVGVPLMNKEGREVTEVKAMQKEQENVSEARRNDQVAISMEGVTMGRQLIEGDILWVSVPEEQFRILKDHKKDISREDIDLLKEISEIRRKTNPMWGV